MHNDSDCKCAKCEAIAAGMTQEEAVNSIIEMQDKALAERGFYVHHISDDPSSPTGYNSHTHGMQLYDEHVDFQLILPLEPKTAHNIICELAERVKSGERFESGQKVDKIIRGFEIKLTEATEGGRKVLRIILPDPNGNLDQGEIDEQYSLQYADIKESR